MVHPASQPVDKFHEESSSPLHLRTLRPCKRWILSKDTHLNSRTSFWHQTPHWKPSTHNVLVVINQIFERFSLLDDLLQDFCGLAVLRWHWNLVWSRIHLVAPRFHLRFVFLVFSHPRDFSVCEVFGTYSWVISADFDFLRCVEQISWTSDVLSWDCRGFPWVISGNSNLSKKIQTKDQRSLPRSFPESSYITDFGSSGASSFPSDPASFIFRSKIRNIHYQRCCGAKSGPRFSLFARQSCQEGKYRKCEPWDVKNEQISRNINSVLFREKEKNQNIVK